MVTEKYMIAPSSQITFFLGLFNNTSSPGCDFKTLLKGFGSPKMLILYATTSITPDLEIFLRIASVEDFRELSRYKTLDTKEAHSSLFEKPYKNVFRVSFI